jgi:hypothetical protein
MPSLADSVFSYERSVISLRTLNFDKTVNGTHNNGFS